MNFQLSASTSSDSQCEFCKGYHNSDHCTTYQTAGSRQQRLRDQGRCNRCLQYGHTANCTIPTYCRHCNKRSHHELVCNLNARNEDWCTLCDTHFNSNECQIFETHSKRAKRVTLLKLCKRCLTHHGSHRSCPRYNPCAYCNQQNHHKVLCRQNPYLKENHDHVLTYVNCIFCNKHLDSGICPEVKTLAERKAIIKEQRRCEKCMRFHPTECCFYRNRCKVCTSPEHHDVICPNDKTLTKDDDLLSLEDDELLSIDVDIEYDSLTRSTTSKTMEAAINELKKSMDDSSLDDAGFVSGNTSSESPNGSFNISFDLPNQLPDSGERSAGFKTRQ